MFEGWFWKVLILITESIGFHVISFMFNLPYGHGFDIAKSKIIFMI
jgi:hypothetical protein